MAVLVLRLTPKHSNDPRRGARQYWLSVDSPPIVRNQRESLDGAYGETFAMNSDAKPKIMVRHALRQEREALEELQWRASLANENDRDALLSHPDAIELPLAQIEAGQVLVADIDGSTVGFAALLPRDDGDIDLDGLFVEPDWWKAGVGRALIDQCSRLGRQMGAATLHVVGNPHALGFYEACGFELVESHATRFGQGMLMRLKP